MYLIEPIRNGKRITDGAVALAMQVYVQENIFLDDDILFPYYCDPKVEIGKFQNAMVETNQDYLKEHQIPVVRRDTGGGAVYVDSGAVNICYLLNDSGVFGDFKRTYQPAIDALHKLGATSLEMTGRNDLAIDGKKVSGAAMTIANERVYGGYSLLLEVDFDAMEKALNPNRKKIESKGIKSVRSRVGAIREHLADKYQAITTEEFKDLMVCHLLDIENIAYAKRYQLCEEDWQQIDALTQEKYKNWDWNYGNSPQYRYHRDGRFAGGTIDIHLEVEKGLIKDCRIYGDFFSKADIHDLEALLIGQKMEENALRKALENIDLSFYLGSITVDELVSLMFS
ncbi:lipoate--protein ligase [Streptococcus ictaluri]|uniref:lipoate--protein ligase n=1 Tax=Streptococcus ictaluri 707-05 TaxID=764299 RepID=G5K2Y8_9STRE|nr:lipoate--protein ligase [Streptococcus ictaluri]EHI69855.1 lipoyltransferase and lipoate-protein ligase [Streptococcus ictaluri 707-05]